MTMKAIQLLKVRPPPQRMNHLHQKVLKTVLLRQTAILHRVHLKTHRAKAQVILQQQRNKAADSHLLSILSPVQDRLLRNLQHMSAIIPDKTVRSLLKARAVPKAPAQNLRKTIQANRAAQTKTIILIKQTIQKIQTIQVIKTRRIIQAKQIIRTVRTKIQTKQIIQAKQIIRAIRTKPITHQSSTNKTNNTGKTNNQSSNNANVSVGDNNLYNSIFNLANKVQVKLTVSTSEMNKLQADYKKYKRFDSKSPIYRKASLTITVNGQSYSMNEVGIRLKGNMSLSPVYDKNGNLNLAHYKLSFNETFDKKEYYGSEAKVWASKAERKARKNRRFATLKKMDLKWNSCYDDTFVREIYAAKMFRDNGVIVQNIGLAQTVFNGNNYGVMKIYEPVDEIMLARFLPQSALGGDLYKCGWTTQPCNYVQNQVTYGVDDKDTGRKYNFNLKTNEKSSNHSSLKKLLSTLASRPDRYAFSSVIDTGYLAKFLAASYFAGDPDDIRNNYNNHYIYFRKDNGKAVFIPYDNDRTLGITYGYNPDGTGMTKPSPYSEMACGARQSQANPVINYGILGSKAFVKSEYTAALKRIADSGIMNVNNFNTYYNLAMNNYNSVVTPSVSFANQSQAFRFSLDGKYTSGDRRNMSFAVYSEKIMKTYHSYVR